MDNPSCFKLLAQAIVRALSRALLNAGSNMAAKIAMIAITTNNSIKVKYLFISMPPKYPLHYCLLLLNYTKPKCLPQVGKDIFTG